MWLCILSLSLTLTYFILKGTLEEYFNDNLKVCTIFWGKKCEAIFQLLELMTVSGKCYRQSANLGGFSCGDCLQHERGQQNVVNAEGKQNH